MLEVNPKVIHCVVRAIEDEIAILTKCRERVLDALENPDCIETAAALTRMLTVGQITELEACDELGLLDE